MTSLKYKLPFLQVGKVSSDSNEMSGKDVLYLYPDFRMAIWARYEDGTFINGRTCDVIGIKR